MDPPSLAELSREELALLVPELLLCGHLIDRAGMPHAIAAFGRDGMRDIAIEEWMGASPVYTRRLQRALGFDGEGGVASIFKAMQVDIGAPPQFMDFRFRLVDHAGGEFWLDHCGALLDVEPLGDEYVVAMCHDIEDPTFDATAAATDPRARVRPVHRPPRRPADRHPHCSWTVTIEPDVDPLPWPEAAHRMGATRAADVELATIDPADAGLSDYAGALVDHLRWHDFSRSALVRIAEEVCLQGHLLALAFRRAVAERGDEEQAQDLTRRQLTGIAGLASERIRAALDLPSGLDGAAAVLAVHPALAPRAYVDVSVERDEHLVVRLGRGDGATVDGAWPSLIDADHLKPLEALVRGVDSHLHVEVLDDRPDALLVEVVAGAVAAPEAEEVTLARFSGGADFRFSDRGTPVAVR